MWRATIVQELSGSEREDDDEQRHQEHAERLLDSGRTTHCTNINVYYYT